MKTEIKVARYIKPEWTKGTAFEMRVFLFS